MRGCTRGWPSCICSWATRERPRRPSSSPLRRWRCGNIVEKRSCLACPVHGLPAVPAVRDTALQPSTFGSASLWYIQRDFISAWRDTKTVTVLQEESDSVASTVLVRRNRGLLLFAERDYKGARSCTDLDRASPCRHLQSRLLTHV